MAVKPKPAQYLRLITVCIFPVILACSGEQADIGNGGAAGNDLHRFMVLDPGHFHAALVFQRAGYEGISNIVDIYAPAGTDYTDHMTRVIPFNTRTDNPADWRYRSYVGPDFAERMINDRTGDIVVISGKNDRKIDRILSSVKAGFSVLADKPWIIDSEKFPTLKHALETAAANRVAAYDIMTERYEITTILQRLLVGHEPLFGELLTGSTEEPSVVKKSVHHLFKYVAGKPNIRPWWFFDTGVQGEGIVDVTTHLVDLVFWTLHPDVPVDYTRDVRMISAEHWPTIITPEQFELVTGLSDIPSDLKLNDNGCLPYFCNGSMVFSLHDAVVQIQVEWDFQPPEGAGDTHFSSIRGSKATVIVLQGPDQGYRPEVYVEPATGVNVDEFERILASLIATLSTGDYTSLGVVRDGNRWRIEIPDRYRIGHEAHFGQVTDRFLRLLDGEPLPEWETANMLAKYYITTAALDMAKGSGQ